MPTDVGQGRWQSAEVRRSPPISSEARNALMHLCTNRPTNQQTNKPTDPETLRPIEKPMTLHLRNSALLRTDAFIHGRWTPADSGQTFAVHDPATGEELAQVANCGPQETQRAIAAAEQALPAWRAKPAKERSAILRR